MRLLFLKTVEAKDKIPRCKQPYGLRAPDREEKNKSDSVVNSLLDNPIIAVRRQDKVTKLATQLDKTAASRVQNGSTEQE